MIENIRTIQKVDENILPFIQRAVKPHKYNKLQNFMTEHGVWGEETYVIYHQGTRENTTDTVYIFQIGFNENQEDLWFVVEEEELK
jgi:hypothetical protein